MFGPKDIKAAHARIKPYLRDTPVIGIEAGGLCDAPVALKLELFQHTGSFKARGGLNAVISSDVPTAGIVAASGGNHRICAGKRWTRKDRTDAGFWGRSDRVRSGFHWDCTSV
jgi:threonine dehydratase